MLYEQYRPKTFEEIVAQDKAVKSIQSALKSGWGGRAFWIKCPGYAFGY